MWLELIKELARDYKYTRPNLPATIEEIREVEDKLKIKLPTENKDLLLEFNGDNDFILSTKQILKNSLSIQKYLKEEYNNYSNFLFIATNGCGDYYGHFIENKNVQKDIFMWDHEVNEYKYVASNLRELIEKYHMNELNL